jgi:hypothetical protein
LRYIQIKMIKTNEIDQVFKDLKREENSKRKRTSLYLAGDLYEEFRLACGDIPPSKVIERLMRLVVEQGDKTA